MRMRLIVISLFTLGVIAPAYADAVFTLGNSHQPNEQNIEFNEPPEMGTTIDGETNISDTMIQFSSTQTLIGSGGQDDIDAQSGNINNLVITVPGHHTFSDLIFNAFKPVANGDLKVTVVTNTGTFTKTYGKTNGENFLTITTTGGEVIESVTIDSVSGFEDLKQPRISGISGVRAVVPEPSTFLLVGSGMLAFLLIQKKGRRLGFKT